MTAAELRSHVVRSTVAGYARLVVRLLLGLMTFRLLFQRLSPEEFGFWSVLWALFGYTALFDFGLGYAVQKRVAELTIRAGWDQLGRVLSTVIGVYVLVAAIGVILGVTFAGALVDLLRVSGENRPEFISALRMFVVAVGIAFPLGLFLEVLQGQQRLTTANAIAVASTASNFAGVLAVLLLDLGFLTLIILSLLSVLIPYATAAWLAMRRLPMVRLSPFLMSRDTLFKTGGFGVHAWLNLSGNVLRHKADQWVLGTILGIAAVTPYQPGSRVAEMFGLMTRQIADVLSPTAAHLHARGQSAALQRLLVDGLRFSVLAATPLYVVATAYLDGLIRLLTGLRAPTPGMLNVGYLLLFWYYSLVMTHWVFKRMFLMAGQERRLMLHGLIEGLASLGLGIVLTVVTRRIEAVAWGALLPAMISGWFGLWGWAAREARLRRQDLFKRVILRSWTAATPCLLVVACLRLQPWWVSGGTPLLVVIESAASLAAGIWGGWMLGLDASERDRFMRRLRGGG
jgi:O-antigen/teichoic acid export membrane protein